MISEFFFLFSLFFCDEMSVAHAHVVLRVSATDAASPIFPAMSPLNPNVAAQPLIQGLH